MTVDQWFRILVSAVGTVAFLGCLGEMLYGPHRGMTWAQFLRYAGFSVVIGTVLWAQYEKRNVPITGYTIAFGVGLLLGSLGVTPRLQVPMRRRK